MMNRPSFRTRLVLLMAVLLFFSYPAVIFALESDYIVPQTSYAPVSTAIGEDTLFPLFCLAAGTLLGGGLVWRVNAHE